MQLVNFFLSGAQR